MTAPLSAEDYAHIREDVHNAILEAQQHDPTVTLEVLFHLLDSVGQVATWDTDIVPPWAREWATTLLENVQTRAVTKVPYEAREYEFELVLDADERGGR